jgi:hypothetical protein
MLKLRSDLMFKLDILSNGTCPKSDYPDFYSSFNSIKLSVGGKRLPKTITTYANTLRFSS